MPDAKRKTLKKKVEAGQARNKAKTETTTTIFDRAGEAAIDAKNKFTAFAKEHPIATVAGGVALGVLIAGMFKGPRRAAIPAPRKATPAPAGPGWARSRSACPGGTPVPRGGLARGGSRRRSRRAAP